LIPVFLLYFAMCASARKTSTLQARIIRTQQKGPDMNRLAWIGIILWGVLVTGFGLLSAGPAPQAGSVEVAAQDVIFLITGGSLTCLIGVIGLMGFVGWIPGLRKEQKSVA
jgi:hypothetical protein